jgi:hypothetical protein
VLLGCSSCFCGSTFCDGGFHLIAGLTGRGLNGPSCMIFRHVYESCVVIGYFYTYVMYVLSLMSCCHVMSDWSCYHIFVLLSLVDDASLSIIQCKMYSCRFRMLGCVGLFVFPTFYTAFIMSSIFFPLMSNASMLWVMKPVIAYLCFLTRWRILAISYSVYITWCVWLFVTQAFWSIHHCIDAECWNVIPFSCIHTLTPD